MSDFEGLAMNHSLKQLEMLGRGYQLSKQAILKLDMKGFNQETMEVIQKNIRLKSKRVCRLMKLK
jgi:hypothetical protein